MRGKQLDALLADLALTRRERDYWRDIALSNGNEPDTVDVWIYGNAEPIATLSDSWQTTRQ